MGALCAISFAVLFYCVPKLWKKRKAKEDYKIEMVVCIAAIIGLIIFGAMSPEVEPIPEVSGSVQQEVVE